MSDEQTVLNDAVQAVLDVVNPHAEKEGRFDSQFALLILLNSLARTILTRAVAEEVVVGKSDPERAKFLAKIKAAQILLVGHALFDRFFDDNAATIMRDAALVRAADEAAAKGSVQ
jgi:hypothetical protein